MIFLSLSSLNPLPQPLYLSSLLGKKKKKKAYVVIFSKSPNPVMSRPSKRFGLILFLPPSIPISNPQAHPSFRRRQYKNLILRAQFICNHHLTDNCSIPFVSEGLTFLPHIKIHSLSLLPTPEQQMSLCNTVKTSGLRFGIQ